MAHELGHFVGLYHTSELTAGDFCDPIPDTPKCLDHTYETISDCPDRTNLMFPVYWAATGGIGVTASPTQVRISRGSPILRAYPN